MSNILERVRLFYIKDAEPEPVPAAQPKALLTREQIEGMDDMMEWSNG